MVNIQINSEHINQDHIPQAFDEAFWLVQFEDYNFTSLCESRTLGTGIISWTWEHSISADLEDYVAQLVDWGGIINKKYGNKRISFNLYIEWEDYDDLILRIDTLKAQTQKVEGNLYIKVRGKWRVYTATISDVIVPSLKASHNFIEWVQITFLVTSGVWKEKDLTSEVIQVTWVSEKIIPNKGTYEAFPLISISCANTWNSITGININIRRLWEVWGFDIYINETITNNDLIIFDYRTKMVTLNWNEIQFFNPMTPLPVGNNVVAITPTGTANFTATISYNKTYL